MKTGFNKQTILITGGTGFIGRRLAQKLLHAGHRVTICARHRPAGLQLHDRLQFISADFARDQKQHWLPRLTGIAAVINCVGIFQDNQRQSYEKIHRQGATSLFLACQQAGVKKLIQISALGADDHARSPYHTSKKAADDALRELDMDWLVVQPSLVYGGDGKSFALFRGLAALPVIPLVAGGRQQVQPIYVDDLADALITAIEQDTMARCTVAAVGPQPLSIKDFLSALRDQLGLEPARFVNVPVFLVKLAAPWLARSCGMPLNRDAVDMLQRGNTAAVENFSRTFGFTPRSVRDILKTHPVSDAQYRHARTYFIWPVFILALAMMWIWTGIISLLPVNYSESINWLGHFRLTGAAAWTTLYGAAALDLMLGLAMLWGRRLRWIYMAQILLMIAYTVLISWRLPQLWLHPFGPVSKNLPLLAATWLLLALRK